MELSGRGLSTIWPEALKKITETLSQNSKR